MGIEGVQSITRGCERSKENDQSQRIMNTNDSRPTHPTGDLVSFRYRISIFDHYRLSFKDMEKEGLDHSLDFTSIISVRNHLAYFFRMNDLISCLQCKRM